MPTDHPAARSARDAPVLGTYRDGWGIPHLRARSLDELAYLQGRNAAQDRLWQIELERWRSEGTTAASLGPEGLEWDRFARRARIDDTARTCWSALDDETRHWVEAYVDGVNSALADGTATAAELRGLGAEPRPWHPWTPLGVFVVQHILFATFPDKLWRAHVAATLGDDAVGLFSAEGPVPAGSNAWALAGGLTASGSPLVAGDPHRVIEAPGVYQQVHLSCPDVDVVGFAFPGVPGVQHFGHNGSVAWAVTNAMADYQDLYREQLRRDGDTVLARERSGWAPATVLQEVVEVRGGDPETVEVVETARGPVVLGGPDSSWHPSAEVGEGISLRTPTRVDGRLGFDALLPLLRARAVADVETALRQWVEPVNSVLVADSTGAVRRLVAGRVPLRPDAARRLPVPAWESQWRWTGHAPLPSADVPDLVVAANDRRPGDTAELGFQFAAPHRGRRIRALLEGRTGLDVDDLAAVHTDTALGSAAAYRALLQRAEATGDAVALRDRLLGWDGRMDAASPDAAAFAAWRSALARRLLDHPAFAPLTAPSGYPELFAPWTTPSLRIGYALATIVRSDGPPGPTAADVVRLAGLALDDVMRDGHPPSWGSTHRLAAVHWLGEQVPSAPLSGDADCVLAASTVPGVSDLCRRGPVARYVWDLGDRSRSRWVVPLGASGRFGEVHAADQLPLWAAGDLVPVVTDWSALTRDHAAEGLPVADRPVLFSDRDVGSGTFSVVRLHPQHDGWLLHAWVTQERARFWGMADSSVEEVVGTYCYLDALPTQDPYLVLRDREPVALLQTYDPAHDEVGRCYDVRPGDLGVHLLVGPQADTVQGLTTALTAVLLRFVFSDPRNRRVVAEPDTGNSKARRRMERLGFEIGPEVDLPGKRARLAFLPRERLATVRGV